MGQLPNLTTLRFCLATFVVLYHVPQFSYNRGFPSFSDWAVFQKGQEAVWAFFALSGFLIIRQLYQEKVITQKVSLGNFYRNRILRIFPLYYLILIFGFFYYKLLLPQMGIPDESNYPLGLGILLGASFFANVLASFHPGGIIEILWSISIEEQFYLLIAPLIWFLPTKRMLGFFGVFTLLYFGIFHSDLIPWLKKFQMLFYYFSMSGILAIISIKYPKFQFPNGIRLIILGLFILYFTTNIFSNLTYSIYQFTSVILIPSAIWALSQQPIPWMENTLLNYFGKISYGIYMYHPILMNAIGFVFLRWINPELMPSLLFIVLYNVFVLGATLLISHFSYQYFEKYFLKKKNSFRKLLEKS